MRIFLFENNHNLVKQRNLQSFSCLNKSNPTKNTLTFARKNQTTLEKLEALPSDAFPSLNLRDFMFESLGKDKNINLLDVHLYYYSALLECESLEEAKEMYPEFQKVVEAGSVDEKIFGRNGYKNIESDKIKGVNLENFSLTLLKLLYGQAISPNKILEEKIFSFNSVNLEKVLCALKLKPDKRYVFMLNGEKHKKLFDNPEYCEQISQMRKRVMNTPEAKQNMSRAKKKEWQDPEYREKMSHVLLERWQNLEYREKISKIRKEISSSPEVKERMSLRSKRNWQSENQRKIGKIVYYAHSKAWEIHPQAKEIYRQISKEFPGFAKILAKIKAGIPLNEGEEQVRKTYFRMCNQKFPALQKEIGKLQKEILANWGFYDENRDLDRIIELYLPK